MRFASCANWRAGDFAVVNSINPDRVAGQKTAAFEIVDLLGDAPDFSLLADGNAGKHDRVLGRISRVLT